MLIRFWSVLVLNMLRPFPAQVLNMFWTCSEDTLTAFRACPEHVLDTFLACAELVLDMLCSEQFLDMFILTGVSGLCNIASGHGRNMKFDTSRKSGRTSMSSATTLTAPTGVTTQTAAAWSEEDPEF